MIYVRINKTNSLQRLIAIQMMNKVMKLMLVTAFGMVMIVYWFVYKIYLTELKSIN